MTNAKCLIRCTVVWSYFNNRTAQSPPGFALSALWHAIYRDVGATLPT